MGQQIDTEALRRRGLSTRAVHAGEMIPLPVERSTTTPIFSTTTFIHPEMESLDAVFAGERPGYNYSRHGNPTIRALEIALANLEGTDDAVVFGSGMAALHAAILTCVTAGSKIVASRELFGATYACCKRSLTRSMSKRCSSIRSIWTRFGSAISGPSGRAPCWSKRSPIRC